MKNIKKIQLCKFWNIIPKNQVLLPSFLQNYDIDNTIKQNKLYLSSYINYDSKFIKIYLNFVMFDCLARDLSNGFFDDYDTPPSELWIDYKKDEYIIAFIPEEYEDIVELCVKETMSESIEWVQKQEILW